MPEGRTFTLQRFGGGNGSNIAHNGPSENVFGPLNIASCMMYKDGGFGDRPVFAPMQADVLRIRKNIPVWTQLHCFHGPGIYGRHLLREVFFGLSQKIEGFSYFTIGFDPESPNQLDNRDTIRTIARELCQPYGDFFMACERGYKKVGIYYSRTAAHLRQRKSLKLSDACEGLWVGCMRAGYPADFLYDSDIIEGEGMEYDVIFAPGWELAGECPPEIQNALKRLVNAGKIVATERASKLPVDGITKLNSPLDEYDDKLGGAFPRYVDFETEMVWNRSEKTTKLVGEFLSKHIEPAGIVEKAPAAEELPVHVGPDWLKCGRGQYMVMANFAYTRFDGLYKTLYQAPDRPRVKFPEKNPACYDVLEMRPIEVKTEDDWMELEPDFRYYPGKIYAFLPREIGGVHLKASPEISAGETIQYRATVTDNKGRPINAGFPVEVKIQHPLGKTLYQVYRVAKPEYSGTYTMPVNVTPGNYTLSVRELIGGAVARIKVKVGRGKFPGGKYDGTTVFVHDGKKIERFLRNNTKVIIARSDSQEWLLPVARELGDRLKKEGIEAEIKPVKELLRTAGPWDRENPIPDGTRMWRGTVVAPGLFVDAPLIVLGRRYENRLVEALIGRGTVPEPLTANFPGQGRAVIGHVRRAFSNEHDTLYVLSRDESGLKRGVEKLLSVDADEPVPVRPKLVEASGATEAKLAGPDVQDWAPSSFRRGIWGEDLVRTIDVDPVSGRILVGTFGYGYNLFCFSRDGDLLWRKFLPEHDVYFARWYDQGIRETEEEEAEEVAPAWEEVEEVKPDAGYDDDDDAEKTEEEEVKKGARRVVAATSRGFHVFLLNGENGDVMKKFASTEWPNYHMAYTEGALRTQVPIRINTRQEQILVRGKTALVALDYEGNRMWMFDRAKAIAEYPEDAEQVGAASFPRSAVMGGLAVSPDGAKIIQSLYRITGSTQI
ncbi:MAG: hypothetical protein KGZ25_14895, partial [Planctomycetes bacterium]|nr:hypothetical protein [Planctomycetota bacterium]